MTRQNINIIDFEVLYNILNEFKTNLSFNIFNYKNIDQYFKTSNGRNNHSNTIFIVKSKNSNLFNNSKIDNRDVCYFEDYPLTIYKLIEATNIFLIKKKYNYQSKINIKDYILDINSRIIKKDNSLLKLTEREIDIIFFLNDKKTPQKVNKLQSEVWGHSSKLETHTVETHIYRLRKKISDKFNDKNFILSNSNGYLIS